MTQLLESPRPPLRRRPPRPPSRSPSPTATASARKSWPPSCASSTPPTRTSTYETIEIGERRYLSGVTSGIDPESWDVLRRTKVFLKAPITTPVGGGYKSLNVTTRKTLGLFANVRRCVSYHPFVETRFPDDGPA